LSQSWKPEARKQKSSIACEKKSGKQGTERGNSLHFLKTIKQHKMAINQDKWTQGYICAVVALIQLNGEVDTRTKELYKSGVGNVSLKTLETIGVDGFDLEILKKHWKDLHN
jgi:hypothetical protein